MMNTHFDIIDHPVAKPDRLTPCQVEEIDYERAQIKSVEQRRSRGYLRVIGDILSLMPAAVVASVKAVGDIANGLNDFKALHDNGRTIRTPYDPGPRAKPLNNQGVGPFDDLYYALGTLIPNPRK